MSTAELKSELIDRIEHADDVQVKQLYGLMLNYFNGHNDIEEWDMLPKYQQDRLNKSLEQADAGLVKPLGDVTKKIREKFGLDG
ncbi:hypothetical protein ACFQZI_01915 [Mucilaginibacter lutimaris]|uniref:Addiction module component n=1 Tax=Mucilaginibacter lutimaris TaxID=931629 RepID=A0ABW2Z9V6_9SPHI